jgi:phospholipid transport system substrate-binding protein
MTRRTLIAIAAAAFAAPLAARADDDPAVIRAPIAAFYAALEAQMQAGRTTPFRQRFHALAPIVERAFDLDTILRVSVGLRWSGLDAEARTALSRAFRRFTVASYVANFDKYEDEKFDIVPTLRAAGESRIVETHIIAANGDTIRMDYQMQNGPDGWRATDILLDGTISRVAVQRSDFRGLLAAGNASALLASLEQKIADLSGGTLV